MIVFGFVMAALLAVMFTVTVCSLNRRERRIDAANARRATVLATPQPTVEILIDGVPR